jgi:NAD(P)-dependent dehydrogenase (short-subunit alcohol dehydrogenase family)
VTSVLVTGATDGLGRLVAERLAADGIEVLIHGRDPARVERTPDEVGAAGRYVADFSSLAQVRRLAEEVERDRDRLDVLVNNAGIAGPRRRELSEDGHELTFQVNYLAGFLLTSRLLPLLRASQPARVVNVASIGQQAIDFDDVMLERGYAPMRAYAQSKLAQIMHAFELAERVPADEVTANALHPATLMDTKMVRENFPTPMSSVEEGAEGTLRLIVPPELEGVSGRYFDGTRESRASPQAYNADARRRLWQLSEELTSPSGSQEPGGV